MECIIVAGTQSMLDIWPFLLFFIYIFWKAARVRETLLTSELDRTTFKLLCVFLVKDLAAMTLVDETGIMILYTFHHHCKNQMKKCLQKEKGLLKSG